MKTTSYKLGGYKIIESDDRYFVYGDATKEGAAVGYQKLGTLFYLKTIFRKGYDMAGTRKWIVFLAAFLVMINGAFYAVLADHDDDHDSEGKRNRHQERYGENSKDHKKRYLTPVDNPIYMEECGGCHFAYQPELLPSGSWDKILAGLEDHYGEVIELDPKSKQKIEEYLKANAAEYSSAKRAVKIMRSLGNRTPLRITEIPYIQEKHHDVSQKVLERDSIGSLSNCSACHRTASKGIYKDDYVVIPP